MKRAKEKKKKAYFDYTLLFLILFMTAFGLVMLYSTSYHYAEVHYEGNARYFLEKQMFATGLGLVLMAFTTFFPYEWWKKLTPLAYIGSLLLCIVVLFVGADKNGSKRWLHIGSLSIQPAEIAKIALIVFLAYFISLAPKSLNSWKNVFKCVLVILPLAGVVALNNLSSGIIIAGIGIAMIFVVCKKPSHLIPVFVLGLACIIGLIFLKNYRGDRISGWLNPESLSADSQILQGLYAIGSGGWTGKGLGESIQKMGSLPEASNDMIFSVVCEELGILGALCVILLFALMIWRFIIIAANAPTLFGSLIVTGITAHIAIQVIFNIAVVTGLFPNTGVTLPFISYGGTAVCLMMAEMGLALSVSRSINMESESEEE